MRTILFLTSIGFVAAAFLATWIATSGGSHETAPPRRDLTPLELRRFGALPVYAAGGRVHGLPLTGNAVTRSGRRADSVSMYYGSCPAQGSDEPRCVYPLEIQSWRACDHSRAVAAAQRPRLRKLRGAELATFPDGRAEVYTGTATVVIFAATPTLTHAAASALKPANIRALRESPARRLAKPRDLTVPELADCG